MPTQHTQCQHDQIFVDSKVLQMAKAPGGPVTSIELEIKVNCTTCGRPFYFSRSAHFDNNDYLVRIPINEGKAPAKDSMTVVN